MPLLHFGQTTHVHSFIHNMAYHTLDAVEYFFLLNTGIKLLLDRLFSKANNTESVFENVDINDIFSFKQK